MANITFKVLTKDPDTALLEFYDYQISESGHTSVRIMEDSYPVNVLEKGPKSFIVTLNKD